MVSGSQLAEQRNLPVIELGCQRDSHHFSDRKIPVTDAVKVGRSVARIKPNDANAIFDCKVLSRNHAVIIYRDGNFYLRDTNSSNGTFVNGTRVPAESEPNCERPLYSGDFIRFGVDVVERETTHGCISAQVFLYHPGGSVVDKPPGELQQQALPPDTELFKSEDMYKLTRYIDEVVSREEALEKKVNSINSILLDTQSASNNTWNAMLNEDKLISKLRQYETEMSLLKANLPEYELTLKIDKLVTNTADLEEKSKAQIDGLVSEKRDALTECQNMKMSLIDTDNKCAHLEKVVELTEQSYQTLLTDHQATSNKLATCENDFNLLQEDQANLRLQLAEQVQKSKDLEDRLWFSIPPPESNSRQPSVVGVEPSQNLSAVKDPEASHPLNGISNGPISSPQNNVDATNDMEHDAFAELNDLNSVLDSLDPPYQSNPPPSVSSTSTTDLTCLPSISEKLRQSSDSVEVLQGQLRTLTHLSSVPLPFDLGQHLSKTYLSDAESNGFSFTQALVYADQLAKHISDCHKQVNDIVHCYQITHSDPDDSSSGSVNAPVAGNASNVSVQTSPAALSNSIKPDEGTATPDTTSVKVDPSNAITELEDKLHQALSEIESHKQEVTTLSQKDVIRNTLLESVRDECKALRARIAEIETEFEASREDHRRLTVEARKARIEADELYREREKLHQRITSQKAQLDELRGSLSHSMSSRFESSLLESSRLDDSPSALRFTSTNSYLHGLTPPMSLFLAIPLMVLLCSLMIVIFLKFTS